jgi:hypothetical protein
MLHIVVSAVSDIYFSLVLLVPGRTSRSLYLYCMYIYILLVLIKLLLFLCLILLWRYMAMYHVYFSTHWTLHLMFICHRTTYSKHINRPISNNWKDKLNRNHLKRDLLRAVTILLFIKKWYKTIKTIVFYICIFY